MSQFDSYVLKWSGPTKVSKEELFQLRDAEWGRASAASNVIAAVFGLTGFIKGFALPAYVLSSSVGFLGMGTYLGNRFDDILRYNYGKIYNDTFADYLFKKLIDINRK